MSMGPFVAPSGPREDDRLNVFEKRLLSERPAGVLVGAEDFQVVLADDPSQEPRQSGSMPTTYVGTPLSDRLNALY